MKRPWQTGEPLWQTFRIPALVVTWKGHFLILTLSCFHRINGRSNMFIKKVRTEGVHLQQISFFSRQGV